MIKGTRHYKLEKLSCEGMPNKIRQERVKRGMSLRALAQILEVSPQAVHQAETKGIGINRRKWYKLADLFDIDPRILEAP